MKLVTKGGLPASVWYAGFAGDQKVTAWYRNKQKAFSVMRKRPRKQGDQFFVRSRVFVEPLPE